MRSILFCFALLVASALAVDWNRANVQIVPNGTHFERNEKGISIKEPSGKTTFRSLPSAEHVSSMKRDSGWIASTWTFDSSYNYYSAVWWVPSTPSNNNGQILFFFNSFENSAFNDILQPVLQFNNGVGGWTFAAWYGAGGSYYEATPYPVSVGQAIQGVIELYQGTWYVTGYINNSPVTQITVSPSAVGAQTSAQFAMEVYSVSSCNMYPSSNYVIVNQITLYDTNGNFINPSWSSSVNANDCNQNAYGSGSAVEITWSS